MPNAGDHQAGAAAFSVIYWFFSVWTGSFSLLFLGGLSGIVGGMMPDILEPATWYGHRGAWHYGGGLFSVIPALFLINSSGIGFLIGSFCLGYFSHFLLDVLS